MRYWFHTPDNEVIDIAAIELIAHDGSGGCVIHLSGGKEVSLSKMSPAVLLSEIKESDDSILRLRT